MMKLEKGLGTVKSVTKMQTVYMHYKPIPNDNNKADVLSVIEAEQLDAYIEQSQVQNTRRIVVF